MEKIINDIMNLLHARLDVINQAEQTERTETERCYIDGKKAVYKGFLETIESFITIKELKNDIEKRREFLRFYSNLYRKRWDEYSYEINNNGQILKCYGDGIYDTMRGRRDACSDLHHELKRMLEVIPDGKN